MGNFLSYLLSNSWLLIPVLIGLFNVGVRLQQKAKEQQARRAAQMEVQRRKAEALRTGKSVEEASIVYDTPQVQQTASDDRQARIEAMRKQRMEQLRAMREKRASIGTKATPPQSMGRSTPSNPTRSPVVPRQTRTPLPAQRPPQARQQQPRQPQPRPPQRAVQRPTRQSTQTPIRPGVIPGSGQQPSAPIRRASISPQQPIRPPASDFDQPARLQNLLPQSDSLLREAPVQPAAGAGASAKPKAGRGMSARAMLRDHSAVRQAIVVRELLGSPIALRNPGDEPGSLQF